MPRVAPAPPLAPLAVPKITGSWYPSQQPHALPGDDGSEGQPTSHSSFWARRVPRL